MQKWNMFSIKPNSLGKEGERKGRGKGERRSKAEKEDKVSKVRRMVVLLTSVRTWLTVENTSTVGRIRGTSTISNNLLIPACVCNHSRQLGH